MKINQIALFAVAAAITLLMLTPYASACPSCAEAMSNDPSGANPAEGFFWSILAMMAMPFLLAGGFGGAVYLHFKKNAAAGGDGHNASHTSR